MARTKITKLKQETAEKIDMISDLPNSLLCHILSFLPIKISVATCTLSRSWRHVWEHLQVFKFVEESNSYRTVEGEAFKNFVQFVNTVLILRRVRDIQKFSLSCNISDDDIHHEVTTWIRGANGPRLQELNITLFDNASSRFVLPEKIFTSTALVSLTLCGEIRLGHLSSVCLPSLKNLELEIGCSNHADKLLGGCPVLETLLLRFEDWSTPSVTMPPSLKRLTFIDASGGIIDSLQLHTPSLEYLDITLEPTAIRSFSASNLNNVVEASLYIFPNIQNAEFCPKLLNMLYRTRYLELRVATTMILLDTPKLEFPQFCCLVRLEVAFPLFSSGFMIDLLHCCPGLQILRISIEESYQEDLQYAPWTKPSCVPYCLLLQLKSFVFSDYRDSADEHAFVAYVLKKGQVLKTVEIYSYHSKDLNKRHHVLKGLSVIPRGSTNCQLIFD